MKRGTARVPGKVEIFLRDGRRCLKCGSRGDLTVDHVVSKCALKKRLSQKMYAVFCSESVLRGHANAQTLCSPCNYRKGARCVDYRPEPLRGALLALLEEFHVQIEVSASSSTPSMTSTSA